jgi:hypothetical protein
MHDLSEEVIRREIDSAFAMWQAAANINFRAAEASLTADILIGAEVEPAGWAFANVSYEAGSEDRLKRISTGAHARCIDATQREQAATAVQASLAKEGWRHEEGRRLRAGI